MRKRDDETRDDKTRESLRLWRESVTRPVDVTFTAEQLIHAAVESAKDEILTDIRAGVIPSNVATFAELHDYVDANLYGGVAGVIYQLDSGSNALGSRIQNELHDWLHSRASELLSCSECARSNGPHYTGHCEH